MSELEGSNDGSDRAYQVVESSGAFAVVGPGDREACRCSTKVNAEHYATLLEAAHRAAHREGYRAGYAAAKATSS